jgi:hypothetical protein
MMVYVFPILGVGQFFFYFKKGVGQLNYGQNSNERHDHA